MGRGRARFAWSLAPVLLTIHGCVDGIPELDDTARQTAGASSSTGPVVGDVTGELSETTPSGSTSSGPAPTTGADSGSEGSTSSSETTGPQPACAPDCPTHAVDVVFVVDNSRTMGPDQLKLASAVDALMDRLEEVQIEEDLYFDLNLMVTTTDLGNPLCTPFEPPGYEPAQGAPVWSSCTSRLGEFTALGGSPTFPEACTEVCPVGVEPDDPFIHVVGPQDNVPGGSAREALRCLLPQGLVGCGYESTLEAMLQALDPAAPWNTRAAPFLRQEADLALVLLTDESDCSIADFSVMMDASYHNADPNTGMTAPSSALCWNAGVTCTGPDAMGVYEDCSPTAGPPLHGVDRYVQYLVDELTNDRGKDVSMVAITGVPEVATHSERPPYEPTQGGVEDLVVHEWVDSPWPTGDILPEEWDLGIDAADKTFMLGIGPGCTGMDGVGGHSQGQPPIRIQAVCEALDAPGSPRCCMESVCGLDYADAMRCLSGMLQTSL